MPDYTGVDFLPNAHQDTYPAIDPTNANLCEKVILISGASRGIGETIAIAFAQAGASGLVLLARSDTKAVETACLAAQRPGSSLRLLSLAVDVTEPAQVIGAVDQVKNTFGRLDVIVNNAGYLNAKSLIAEGDPYDWWKVWEINVRGMYNLSHAFIPSLLECGGDKLIVNVSSNLANVTWPGISAYQSSKFATLRLTESIMADHGSQGVLAFVLHPCATPTQLNASLPPEIRKLLVDTPELAAHTIVWLVRERREWLAGRYFSCGWDVDELSAKKQEIVDGDKLKMRMIV